MTLRTLLVPVLVSVIVVTFAANPASAQARHVTSQAPDTVRGDVASFPEGHYMPDDTPDVVLLHFAPDGRYELRRDGTLVVTGRWEARGDSLLLSDDAGRMACSPEFGVYRWRWDGERLALVALDEPCAARRLVLATALRPLGPR